MDNSSTNDTVHYNMKKKSLSKMSIDNITNMEDYQKETKKLNSSDTYISTNTNNHKSSNNSTNPNPNNSLNHISQSTTPNTSSINNLNNHSDSNINVNTTNTTKTVTNITTTNNNNNNNNNNVNEQNDSNNSNIIPHNNTIKIEVEKSEINPSTNRVISNNNSKLTNFHKPTLSIPKAKNNTNNCIYLPKNFYEVDINHLIYLIAEMLEKLTKYNDQITLTKENLTRFHSRKAPEISIYDYLKRIVKYAAIDKVALLSLLIYIDRICKKHRLFTISSLTVHRFIITSLTCASKAMCDSICTNLHYSKVGGIHVKELNLLELEFLFLIDWNLVCTDVSELQQYYENLVRQSFVYHIMPEPGEEINSKSLISEDNNQNDNNYSKGLHDVD
jgi:hypothetical protein